MSINSKDEEIEYVLSVITGWFTCPEIESFRKSNPLILQTSSTLSLISIYTSKGLEFWNCDKWVRYVNIFTDLDLPRPGISDHWLKPGDPQEFIREIDAKVLPLLRDLKIDQILNN